MAIIANALSQLCDDIFDKDDVAHAVCKIAEAYYHSDAIANLVTLGSLLERNSRKPKPQLKPITGSYNETNLWTYDKDGYNGPDNWELSFSSCGGVNQSPINIDTSAVQVDPELGPFLFHNIDNPFVNSILYNTGHSAQLILKRSDAVKVKGGGLRGNFQFDQLHFHWDSTSMTQGSEHTINGRHYPVEMHLVAYNEKYPNFTVASLYEDGIAVFAVFIKYIVFFVTQLSDSRNYVVSLQPIVENFEKISIPGSAVKLISPIYFRDLLPGDFNRYFRYQGSLTTPPCSEVVTWTVFEETLPVSANEVREKLKPNFPNSNIAIKITEFDKS
ncbi:carbonic anhydrase 2-like [Tachypleus tridentatus]|uniref:carbonic anhydrase 2-like n=1 Tax=Tachypleus tridentatus TaxID=6853 RepID=UPI003FD477A0